MDKEEARAILGKRLEEYRRRSYAELQSLLDAPERCEVTGDSGVWYQLEFQAVWDDKPGGDLRVMGAIDDGGLRAFFPLQEDFILTPHGRFVGESLDVNG